MSGVNRTVRILLLVLVLVLSIGGVLIDLSRNDMLVAGGSDSTTSFYRPPIWAQLLALLLLCFSFFGASGGLARRIRLRLPSAVLVWGGATIFSLAAFMMSLHQLTISDHRLSEVWCIWQSQSIPLSEEWMLDASFSRSSPFFLNVQHPSTGKARFFLGLFPWSIDAEEMLTHPLIRS